MAQFNQITTMTITQDDRAWLSFGNYVIAEIVAKMDEVGATDIVNTETGELLEREDLKKVFDVVDSLLDKQECWTWELV